MSNIYNNIFAHQLLFFCSSKTFYSKQKAKFRRRISHDVVAQEYHSDRSVIWSWVKDGAVKTIKTFRKTTNSENLCWLQHKRLSLRTNESTGSQ